MTDDIRVVFISIPREEAKRFAKNLVASRLVACANIIPQMESFYWWNDKVLADNESLLILKTTWQQFAALQEYVEEHHPYEIPELISLKVAEGLPDYLAWIKVETERE